MSELTEKIQKEMDVWEDLREYGIFEGVGIAKEIIEEHELQHEIKLNENQQIVLDRLKSNSNALKVPMLAIYELAGLADEKVRAAYRQLNREEQYQVLAAFAEWGCKSNE